MITSPNGQQVESTCWHCGHDASEMFKDPTVPPIDNDDLIMCRSCGLLALFVVNDNVAVARQPTLWEYGVLHLLSDLPTSESMWSAQLERPIGESGAPLNDGKLRAFSGPSEF